MIRAALIASAVLLLPTPANAALDPAGWELSRHSYSAPKAKAVNKKRARKNTPRRHKSTGGLSPRMAKVVADLRTKHGAASVRIIAGRSYRYVAGSRRLSCHASGEAIDAYLSPDARADVRRNRLLGVITYSGAMRHWHVSVCRREAGYRGHQVIGRVWPVASGGAKDVVDSSRKAIRVRRARAEI